MLGVVDGREDMPPSAVPFPGQVSLLSLDSESLHSVLLWSDLRNIWKSCFATIS